MPNQTAELRTEPALRNMMQLFLAVFMAGAIPFVSAKGLSAAAKTSSSSKGLRASHSAAAMLDDSLGTAMGEALGCGGQVDEDHLASIERDIRPSWLTLPKSSAGRVDRRSLRYVVHRHFSRRSALHIRGFEPNRPTNASGWGEDDILGLRVPAFVETVLQSKHKLENGFDLSDAALMIATLEQLIFDSESATLEQVYNLHRRPITNSMSTESLSGVLESYMVHWMMGEDKEGIRVLLNNRTLLETAFPHWHALSDFVRGEVKTKLYKRQRNPSAGQNPLNSQFTFDDAHSIVGGITRSFASYWESECTSMKTALVSMDVHHTGRVPLAKFYRSALETDWRFGESESYLRELGALDETNTWHLKQVIIPNYIQATSNCIVSSSHYSVCCVNDCEAHLADIENAVGAPAASVDRLLSIVGNMTSTLDEDTEVKLEGSLTQQLEQIAATSGGEVPLHGRLFAQWLHYVFPRECAFPYKMGEISASSPSQFGDGYIASEEDMKRHALTTNETELPLSIPKEDLEWMSQWSPEEELLSDDVALHAPWESSRNLAWGGLLMVLIAWGLFGVSGLGRKSNTSGGILPVHSKSHVF